MTVIVSTLKRGGGGTSPFPTTTQDDAKLPYVIATDITARDNIPEWKRISRMYCDVLSDGKRYRLGTDLTIAGQVWAEEPAGANIQTRDEKNQPSGYVGLNAEGYVNPQYIRSIYAQDYFTADNETERFALDAKTGDICHQLDNNNIYIKKNNNVPPTIAADWADITPTSVVASVNGQTGVVIIDFSALLAYGNSYAQFETAIANSVPFTQLQSQIANNDIDIATLYGLVSDILGDDSNTIPLWDNLKGDYEVGNCVLYDTGSFRKNLYRCKEAPPQGTGPSNTTYWEIVGDFYTRQEIDDKLALKADLVLGKVPVEQLPLDAFVNTYIVADLTERNNLTTFDNMRVIVMDASGDARLPKGGVTEYLYRPTDPQSDTNGYVWLGADNDQAFDFARSISRVPELGQTPGGETITEGIENMFFGPVVPFIQPNTLPLAIVGSSSQATITGVVSKQDADTIDRIDYVRVSDETILQSDVPVNPNLDTQTLNYTAPAITMLLGVTETYRVDVIWTKDGNSDTTKGSDIPFEGVYPMLYGNATDGLADLYTLDKLLQKQGNSYVGVTGSNRTYFAYPETYDTLVSIVDQHQDSQTDIHFPLSPAVVSVTSTGLAANWTINYKLHKSAYNAIMNGERYGYLFNFEDTLNEGSSSETSETNQQKLDSIQWGAQVNQDDVTIKTQYENNNDTNAFTDAYQIKLISVQSGAQVNQDDATIKTQYENNADTNALTDARANKLDTINLAELGDMTKDEFAALQFAGGVTLRTIEQVALGFNFSATDIPHGRYLVVEDVNPTLGYATIRLADNTNNDIVDAFSDELIPAGGTGRIAISGYNDTIDTTGAAIGDPVYLGQGGVATLTEPTIGSLIRVGKVYGIGNPGFVASLEFINKLLIAFDADWRAATNYPKWTTYSAINPLKPGLGYALYRAIQDHISGPTFAYPNANNELVGGDMKSELYDPQNAFGDAFDMSSMIDNASHVRMTTAERTKLNGLEDPTFKGYFATPNALNAAYPTGQEGWSAIVTYENDGTTLNGNLWQWVTSAWVDSGQSALGGNMLKATYDPTNVNGDAFLMDNMLEGSDLTKLFFTNTERTKLTGLQEGTSYYTKTEVDSALVLKADITYVDSQDTVLQNQINSLNNKIRGGLYYDSGGTPTTRTAGEVNPTTTLFPSIQNVTSPAAGRLATGIAGDVMVTCALTVEMVANTTSASFQIAVNGTIVPGAISRAKRATSSGMVANPTVTVPLTLAATDYVSIIMAGSSVLLHDFTLSITGAE